MFWTPIRYAGAVHLSSIDLWLDPRRPRDWAFISHAHSDHVAAHATAITSHATAHFLRARGVRPRHLDVLPYRETRSIAGVDFTLYPAGHMLGSAQLLVEIDGGRLLFSGDVKLRANAAAETAETPRADVLVMETTFGHPRYVFPPTEETAGAMVAWCRERLAEGVTPLLLAYSLGKTQEVLAHLAGTDLPVLLHGAGYDLTRIAEGLGVTFPPFGRWSPGMGAGAVVIAPPHLRRWLRDRLPEHRAAIVSGWAIDPRARYRYGADAAFPLSDHADYPDLLAYVQAVGASRVYTVHGYAADFAADLRRRGLDATALDDADQLALF